MCRWLAYYGNPIPIEWLLYRPKYSLIVQSLHSRYGATTTNGDGVGVGWYDRGETPGLYRSVHPAWNNRNLRDLSQHISARIFFAHIRASTGSAVQETNCHPFRYGRWLFMHNGLVRELPRVRRDLLLQIRPDLVASIEGSTDSELLFFLALTFGLEHEPIAALERMAGCVEDVGAAHGIQHPLQMTVAVSNGDEVIAARYSSEGKSRSLYFSRDAAALKKQHPEVESLQHLDDEARAVVSEPLGDMADVWQEVPDSHVGVVRAGPDELRRFVPRRGA